MRHIRLPLTLPHAPTPRRIYSMAWACALLLLLAACGDDPTDPMQADVVGAYTATAFVITANGSRRDILAAGGSLDIILDLDGTTAGHLFVPDAAEGGGDFDASLGGTWTISGNTVRFTQSEDTFVRDVAFTADGGMLRTDSTLESGVRIQITLNKIVLDN